MFKEVRGKQVVVMGLGRFGGGVGVTRWLAEQGAHVTVTDMAGENELSGSISQLADLPIRYRLGGHDEHDLDQCELLVVSPAVDKLRSGFVTAAARRNIPHTSEMNLFLERCPTRLVGVTGSVGKSTTTAMIGAILSGARQRGPLPGAGRVFVGGNIGRSLLAELPHMKSDDVTVLELSSFQLEDAAPIRRSPHLALLTNLRPNHLDRHGTLDAYAAAKLNIVRFQRPGDLTLVNVAELDLRRRLDALPPPAAVETFADEAALNDLAGVLRVPGRHNLVNAAGARAVAQRLGVPDEITLAELAAFRGLEHRLEFVRECHGVGYFNDSKSTTPEAALIALAAFGQPVIMLLGGYDKGVSFDELAAALGRAKAVVCYGATGPVIAERIKQRRSSPGAATVVQAADLAEATARAAAMAAPGDVVVLSPACASYDQFVNYEQRGDLFKRLVAGL